MITICGVELVGREGAAASGLREIARAAGVSHGAPRRYFPTHHALLAAIARAGYGMRAARIGAIGAVRFGPPLTFPDGGAPPVRRRATDEIMDAVGALSGQDRAGTYSPRAE